MLNLVPAIREIESEIREIQNRQKAELDPYLQSLAHLRKINEACEECSGKGKKLRVRACAEDDRPDPNDPNDYVPCLACGGTGHKVIVFKEV